jgi:hypothetical protein
MSMKHRWNDTDRGRIDVLGGKKKTCRGASVSTTNTTRTCPRFNPGLCGKAGDYQREPQLIHIAYRVRHQIFHYKDLSVKAVWGYNS